MTDAETRAYYSRIADLAEPWQRADWGSRDGQRIRHDVLLALLAERVLPGESLLDVGCGDGTFLMRVRASYQDRLALTGWDVAPAALASAAARVPTATFEDRVGIPMADGGPFDWVTASGLWTYRSLAWAQDALASMWTLCRRGLLVNSLSTLGREAPRGELALAPADFLAWGLALSPKVTLRMDYWPGDMTLGVLR